MKISKVSQKVSMEVLLRSPDQIHEILSKIASYGVSGILRPHALDETPIETISMKIDALDEHLILSFEAVHDKP